MKRWYRVEGPAGDSQIQGLVVADSAYTIRKAIRELTGETGGDNFKTWRIIRLPLDTEVEED